MLKKPNANQNRRNQKRSLHNPQQIQYHHQKTMINSMLAQVITIYPMQLIQLLVLLQSYLKLWPYFCTSAHL